MIQEIKGIDSVHGIRYPYFAFQSNFKDLKPIVYRLKLIDFEFLKSYDVKDNKVELHLSCPRTFFYQIFSFEIQDNKLTEPVEMLIEGDKIDSQTVMFDIFFKTFKDQEWVMYETNFNFKLELSFF